MIKKHELALSIIVFCCVTAVIFIYGSSRRVLVCWDAVPYIAMQKIIKNGDADFKIIHEETYAQIDKEASTKDADILSWGEEYRSVCRKDPEALRQQMKFYSVKPAYNYFNVMLSSFNMSEFDALYVNALIFSALIYLLILYYLYRMLGLPKALLLTPLLFVLGGGTLIINSGTTPDTMLAFFSLLALLLVLEKKYYWGLLLLLVTIPIRSDSAMRYFIVVAAIAVLNPQLRWRMGGAFAAGCLFYILYSTLYSSYPWHVFFYHSHISRLMYPENVTVSVTVFDYVKKLAINTHYIVDVYMFMIFAASFVSLRNQRISKILAEPKLALVACSLAFFVGHYLLHPEVNIRYFLTDSYFTLVMAAGAFFGGLGNECSNAPQAEVRV